MLAYALSNDSDLFLYPSVRELIRPVWNKRNKRNKFQHFNNQAVLTQLAQEEQQQALLERLKSPTLKGQSIATRRTARIASSSISLRESSRLQLDELQLLLVGIVTKNDYNQQFENYGVATNMEIARELREIGMLPNNALVLGSSNQALTTMAAAIVAYINHITNPGQVAPAAAQPIPALFQSQRPRGLLVKLEEVPQQEFDMAPSPFNDDG
ncbi:hypothetical protein EC968_006059 [Mortierella alpina]|nr:hypothetical protein EC968_006059 [Mortierella alpina]